MIHWEKFIQSGFRMPFYMNLYIEGKVNAVQDVTGWNHPCSLVVIERQMNTVYESPEVIQDYGRYVALKLSEKKFRERFVNAFQESDAALLKKTRALYFKEYEGTLPSRLESDLAEFSDLFKIKFGIYGLPKFTDLAITSILPTLLSVVPSDEDLAVLTKPLSQSEYTLERVTFLKIVKSIQDQGLAGLFSESHTEVVDRLGRYHPALYYEIETYARIFAWITVNHHVQPLTLDTVLTNIVAGLADVTTGAELKRLQKEVHETKEKQAILYSRYQFKESDFDVLNFVRSLNEINESRKVSMGKAILWSYPLFQALADFFKVDVISIRQLTSEELKLAIRRGLLTSGERELIRERLEYYVCMLKDGVVTSESGARAKVLALRELGQMDYSAVTELKGKVAQVGKVIGLVRLILSEHQVVNLLPGEILVTSMTDPNMVPAMKRAGAIVTDEGGITCHAAIISRELKVPCIIATKIATKVLKTGDFVDVDAEKGIVKILKRAL